MGGRLWEWVRDGGGGGGGGGWAAECEARGVRFRVRLCAKGPGLRALVLVRAGVQCRLPKVEVRRWVCMWVGGGRGGAG